VLVDDLSFAIGAEGPVDFVTGQAGCVVRNRYLLIGQGAADDYPGGGPTRDQ
jgi:hypothetical protein